MARILSCLAFLFLVAHVVVVFRLDALAADQRVVDDAVSKAIEAIQKTGGREITLTAVENTVTTLKDPIAASGSHVRGLYTPGKSDHDFTLLLGNELGPDEALDAWKTARRRLSTEIKNETLRRFETNLRSQLRQAGITDPAEINRLVNQARPRAQQRVQEELVNGILERTNLYPPDLLMKNASGSDDAMRIYREMQAVPNLGVQDGAHLSDDALKKATEGLYGPGSKAYRQGYEKTAGVIWEIDPRTGLARKKTIDLTHLSQGYGKYTLEGMSSNARQWSDKVLDALAEGDYRTAFKDLERLHLDLKKARDLASIPAPGSTGIEGFYNQYNEIKKTARELYPGDAAAQSRHVRETIENLFQGNPGLKSQIQQAVGTAKKEARLLSHMSTEAALKRKAFIRNMLDVGSESGGRLRNALDDLYEKYGHHVSFGNFLSAIFIALDTAEAASRHGQGDTDGAIRKAFEAVLSIPPALLPAGLMAALTNMIIDTAKDAGYVLAVSSQDCEDLLAGIISVKGWEHAAGLGEKTETNIDGIARRYALQDQVKRLVETLARNAAMDQDGTETINAGKERALVARCTEPILAKWRQRRREFIYQYIEMQGVLNELFSNLQIHIQAEPNPAPLNNSSGKTPAVDVSIRILGSNLVEQIDAVLQKMLAQIQILGGHDKIVTQSVGQNTECFLNDDPDPFYTNRKFQVDAVLDETGIRFDEPQTARITCRLQWEVVVVSAITDPGDTTTRTFEILGPLANFEFPGYVKRLIPGDVVGTHKEQLDRTYLKSATTLVRVEAAPEDGSGSQGDDAKDEPDSGLKPDQGQTPGRQDAPAQPDDYRRTWGEQGDPDKDQGQTPTAPPVAPPGDPAPPAQPPAKPGTAPPAETPEPGTPRTPVDGPGAPDGPEGPGTPDGPGIRVPEDVPPTPTPGREEDPEPPKPSACVYEYSEWGPCDRDSKKQTRTVIGTSPPGCVQSGQPSLEQGCRPPPTEEEMFGKYMHCLCFHSPHGWAGHIGVGYGPTGHEGCGGSGPCVGGFGAWGNCRRHFISTTEEQKKSCYEGAYGKDSWDPEKANALIKEENDKAKLPLELKLNIEECPVTVQLGEIVNFTATPQGGIPPYTYSWSGNGQAEEQKFTFANSREPGTHPVSVTVSDSDGSSATAECAIIVDAVTVTIEKTSPAENELPVGAKASFRATVTSAGKPVGGELLYRWEPHPEVQFGDEANPRHETTSASTTATYLRPGSVGMWVNVLRKEGETARTIGESDQLPLSIIGPSLTLTADTSQPRVGDTVVVTVKEEPAMKDDVVAFVWEVQGDVLSAGAAPNVPNHRAHSFVFKDAQPVTVTVAARTKVHGDDLGEASIELAAQGYEVEISGPEYRGPKPRIWKCDGQLGTAKNCRIVEVDRELAVFRDLGLTAKVTPEPEKGPVKYKWSIDPAGSCGIPGAGRELTINCSQTGTYLVRLEARDSRDVVLGQASKSVAITISQEDLDDADRLKVTLEAGEPVRVGEAAAIQAEVAGGKAPLTFTWSAGVEGADQSATFTPTQPGAQTITVQVADADGKKGEARIELDVRPAPLAVELTGDPSSLKVGETATLTATITGGLPDYSVAWTGASGSGESAQWTPEQPGEQEVSVEVTDKNGETATASLLMDVQPLPLQVALSADKAEVKLGDAVAVQAEVSGGRPDFTYAWTGATGQGQAATFTAEASGRQVVGVQVTDADGQTADAEVELTVTAPPLKVTLASDTKEVRVGETVQLTARVAGGEPDFGFAWSGGPQGQGGTASWVPDEPGDHDVAVEVTDKGGQKASAATSITVKAPRLVVTLTSDKTEVAKGDRVKLTAAVTGGQPEYTATWGKDISGNGLEGTWYAGSAGKQTLSVIVRDKSRQTEKASIKVNVKDTEPVITDDHGPLRVELTADQTRIQVGGTATLRAVATGGTGPYVYSGSQAVQDNGETGLFTPTETGFYQLFVDVRDAKQARQTAKIDIQVEQGAPVPPGPVPSTQGGPLSVSLHPERTALVQGESMTIQARVKGGREPYAYSWSRTVHGAGETVVFAPADTGYYQIFVEVRDADQSKATAQVNVQVRQGQAQNKVEVRKQAPAQSTAAAPGQRPAQSGHPSPSTAPPAKPYSIAGDTRARKPPDNIDYEQVGEMISGLNQGLGTRAQEIEAATSTNATAAPIPESYGKVGFGAKPEEKKKHKDKKHGKPDDGSHSSDRNPESSPGTHPGGLKDVVVNSRTITLSIWDHGKVDNDIVTIKVNGAPVSGGSNVTLTKQPKTFQLQLNTGRNEITIYAVNEGTQPPNTASFRLSNVTQGEPEQKYRINQGENASFGATVVIQ